MKYLDNLISEITIKQKLEKERKKVNTKPSEKQKESGNYTKGHININGFEITIENPKGSYRKGVDSNGKEWKIKMNNDYGYFLKSIGYDGDHIDVFLGNDFDSKKIFVVDQKINGKFDESKVMLGFKTSNEAKKAYLSNYEKDWKGFHKITEVDEETFKSWLYDGKKQRKAFSEYKDMKLNETVNKIVKNILIESRNSRWEELLASVEQRLANGEDYKDVFDNCHDFKEGFANVELNGKWNLINQEGKFLSNQWFDFCEKFYNGFAGVMLNGKCNFINQEGELLSNQWFDWIGVFYDGITWVMLNGKYNFINEEGKLISNQWFDRCHEFRNGFAGVQLNGEEYIINRDGVLFDSNGNPVNINENISKKFKPMKINESKIRRIVNESIKRVLLEDKEQTRLTKILIKKLYKVAQNYKQLYRDNDWRYLKALMADLSNVPGVIDFNYGGGKYHQNGENFGELAYKLYTVEIETEFDTLIKGEVYCNFAGTIDDPWSRYDMTVNFWMDSGINESKYNSLNNGLMFKDGDLRINSNFNFSKISPCLNYIEETGLSGNEFHFNNAVIIINKLGFPVDLYLEEHPLETWNDFGEIKVREVEDMSGAYIIYKDNKLYYSTMRYIRGV